jgi:hypothetical protein
MPEVARCNTIEVGDPVVPEVVGFKGEHHGPSYRSVTPLDARRLPTFN